MTMREMHFRHTVMGHPAGLFVLFFTEMWERFSYYGMRILLMLFLVAKVSEGGWEWSRKEAALLFSWYVMLVYITPLIGGWLADNVLGYVRAVIIGSVVMTLGHLSLALADLPLEADLRFFFYIGLLLLVIGTGFFKPNMTSIISQMYPQDSPKKDGAYTIFYMGVNAGAFIGTLLVGWLGERVNWSYGFGLAGVFMLFGLLQFYFGRHIFGERANMPAKKYERQQSLSEAADQARRVPFTPLDKAMAIIGGVAAVLWVVDGLYYAITRGSYLLPEVLFRLKWDMVGVDWDVGMSTLALTLSIVLFVLLGLRRIGRYEPIERDRLIVVFIFATTVVFFWMSFEQAGTSMTIFAKDYTNRVLTGGWKLTFQVVDTLLSLAPLVILTWVIYLLFKAIGKVYPLTIAFTVLSFAIIWVLSIYRLKYEYGSAQSQVAASWFQILNPFFIITLAPLFSKLWERVHVPGPLKFSMGLSLLAMGFAALAFGAREIPAGAQTASVSMIWLILAYLLHTLGELSLSPVGLSYVSKLTPPRMIAFVFGIWYIFISIANKLAGVTASYVDDISQNVGMSGFFLIFTLVPLAVAALIALFSKRIVRMMHGIE